MIFAVDFDGTLCRNAWPGIGAENAALIGWLKRRKQMGDTLILWTMREGEKLLEAIDWCAVHGLRFDAVNDNAEEQKQAFGNNPRKVYADCYIDDHNAPISPFANAVIWEAFCLLPDENCATQEALL